MSNKHSKCDDCYKFHLPEAHEQGSNLKPSISTQLEEILPCTISCGSNADPNDGFGHCTCGAEETQNKLTALISTILTEVIGEDEKHFLEARMDTDLEHGRHLGSTDGRNQLRAEQRATATRLLGLK